MPDDAGEMYVDRVKGIDRPRRGPRKRNPRGPYSAEEAAMIDAFDQLLSAERHMHGTLAQPTCRDITALLARLRYWCEEYCYANVPVVAGIDPHIIMEEMDLQPYDPSVDVTTPSKDEDIYAGLI